MALAKDIFDIGKEILNVSVKQKREELLQVAQHFEDLSKTFLRFPPAHRGKKQEEMEFLVAKTRGLIQGLSATHIFANVLGENAAESFFGTFDLILNEKIRMASRQSKEQAYIEMITAAGYLEGYSESLRAQALTSKLRHANKA